MKSIPAALAEHLAGETVTLATCWIIEKRNGLVVRGTDHDQDITITAAGSPPLSLAGTYYSRANITGSDNKSGSDLAADNMEVEGALQAGAIDLTVAEMESGVLDGAPVTVFLVNWRAPSNGQVIIRRGRLGAVSRDSDGRYQTEVRGLTQLLSQNIVRVYGDRCDVARFGDTRCGFNVASITSEGTVASVTSRKEFTVLFTGSPNPSFPSPLPAGGEVQVTSGENTGFTREVKAATFAVDTLTVELFDELPDDLATGDAVRFVPGCDRRYSTCRDTYQNLVNFRGHGVFVPGNLTIQRGPATSGLCEIPDP